jgi:tetratricopeptide (TPR) repeat protein
MLELTTDRPREGVIESGHVPLPAAVGIPRSVPGLSRAIALPGPTVVLIPPERTAGGGPDGLGGTGKTQTAIAVLHRLDQDYGVRFVVWVTATSRDAVLTGYARALRDARGPGPGPADNPEQAAAQFLVWLAWTDRPWVVVLDDLADAAVMDGLWPAGPAGRVVVTTEQPGSVVQAPDPWLVPVGPFTDREALGYLSAELHTDKGQLIGGLDLAQELGFLPITLAHAAAVMITLRIGSHQYRAQLAEYRGLLGGAGRADPLPSIAAALLMSAEVADRTMAPGLCWRTLILACVLAPHGIPGLVLTSDAACEYVTGQPGGSAGQRAQASAAVRSLARAGLLSMNPDSVAGTIVVHPLVQAVVRQQPSAPERQHAAWAAAEALMQAWSRPGCPPDVAQRLRACAASLHGFAGPLLWSPDCHPVLLRAGHSLNSSGLTGSAASYWQDMLGTSQRMLGTEHARTAVIREEFAVACEASGRLTEAISLYEAAAADQERAQSISHADTGAAWGRLARAYAAAGRNNDAIRLAREALASFAGQPGSEADALTTRGYLARAYQESGQTAQAVATFRDVLAGAELFLGPDHPQTIAARRELSVACCAADRPKEAIDLGRQALADAERVCGGDHADTLAARTALAAAFAAARKHKRALPLLERVLADRERLQGPDHPDAISARADLAAACLAAGWLAAAVTHYEQIVAACERVHGPGDQRTRAARDGLRAAAARGRAVLGIELRSRTR